MPLREAVSATLRLHDSPRTEDADLDWIGTYITLHGRLPPHLPAVLPRREVVARLDALDLPYPLIAWIWHGRGPLLI